MGMEGFDRVVCLDCLDFLRDLPDECVDVVITSPPYAEQRKGVYDGISADDFPDWMVSVGREIFRVLKPSGSFVLNIKEHVNKGARDTYVLKTVLGLVDLFVWSDTFIWAKKNPFPTGSKKRLKDGFEYCYFFTKTKNHKFFPNHVLSKSTSKYHEGEKRRANKGGHNVTNGSGMNMGSRCAPDMVRPSNVLFLATDSTHHKHPATFPIGLPEFFIKLLTEEGDIVCDPFMGSGTTLVAAKQLKRHYIGNDIKQEYVDITENRLKASVDFLP